MTAKPKHARIKWKHIKLVLTSGVGFMTDAYDLFIIGIVSPMLGVVYFNGHIDPVGDGLLKASAAWGTLIGQLFFGIMADRIGRKNLFALVLMMITFGTIASAITGPTQAVSVLGMLGFWRVFLGLGIGGDYPISGVMTAEFSDTNLRGALIAAVFAMQGVGILLSSVVSVIVILILQEGIKSDPIFYLDIAWRLCIGLGAIPGIVGVYYRLKIEESPRYKQQVLHVDAENKGEEVSIAVGKKDYEKKPVTSIESSDVSYEIEHSTTFFQHFGQWKNFRVLLGTSVTWFALDVGFYGTNLNTPTILQVIGFGGGDTTYIKIWNQAYGSLIIALLGAVPGYWFTVFLIERLGRKKIQYGGFAILTVLFAVLGVCYTWMTQHIPIFITIYTLIQFFNNFGPNATTFVLAGEVFPTRFRTTAHGISAASGKLGAIIAAQGFSAMKDIGGAKGEGAFVPTLLIIFSVFMAIGLFFTWFVPETAGRTLEEICGERALIGTDLDHEE